MNRESAKLLGFSKEARKTEYSGNYIHLDNVMDIVFDDFESRTCKNCKYFNGLHCSKLEFIDAHHEDFGCNKHEPKET